MGWRHGIHIFIFLPALQVCRTIELDDGLLPGLAEVGHVLIDGILSADGHAIEPISAQDRL
jgi:hypothetical protein